MSYIKGNVTEQQKSNHGSLTGCFFEKDSLKYDQAVEINFSALPTGFSAPKHLHSKSKTWVIVVKGKMTFKLDNQIVEVNGGEFIIFPAGTPEEVVSVDPETENITLHSPCIPGGDKVTIID